MVETPYPVYFEQALNCIRILSRLLTVMTECETESTFVRKLLWQRQQILIDEDLLENDRKAHGESLDDIETVPSIDGTVEAERSTRSEDMQVDL